MPLDTKARLLDAAEALFARHGYDNTSLRQLTTRAGVNLAGVNYHFGSKEQLALAVLARRVGPVNAERRRRLEALPARPDLHAVLRAFVEPLFPTRRNRDAGHVTPGPAFCRLFGRLMVDQPPFLRGFLAGQFRTLGRRFVTSLQQNQPHHDAATLWWRLHFLVGAMAQTLHGADALAHLTQGACDAGDADVAVEEMITFAAAGFAAPATNTPPRRQNRSRR